jgi:hypothetical protein
MGKRFYGISGSTIGGTEEQQQQQQQFDLNLRMQAIEEKMQKRFQIYDKVEHKIKGAYYKLI